MQYHEERRERHAAEDALIMQRVAHHSQQQPAVPQLSDEEQALFRRQANERKLRALARDPSPSELWMPRATGEALHEAVEALAAESRAAGGRTERTERDGAAAGGRERPLRPPTAEELGRREQRRREMARNALRVGERHGRQALPAWAAREAVVAAVRGEQVTVVSGETGCGKSTQVPQFLLDDAIERGEGGRINIIVTQPRRIAATALAERVASERGEAVGRGDVGYQVRLERVASPSACLMFVTTGILLRRLQLDPQLEGVTHVSAAGAEQWDPSHGIRTMGSEPWDPNNGIRTIGSEPRRRRSPPRGRSH